MGGWRVVHHRLRIREPRLVICFVIVYDNQVFRTSCWDGTRAGNRDGCQAEIDGGAGTGIDAHLLSVFVEWLCTAEPVPACCEIIWSRCDGGEPLSAVTSG